MILTCLHSNEGSLRAVSGEQCSESTRDYLVSVIYGYDMVGRLGAATLEDLKARLFHALCVCNVPKFKMLGSRMSICTLNKFFPCCRSAPFGEIDWYLTEEMKKKLLEPDLNEVYTTPEGSYLKPFREEVYEGVSKVDRLLPGGRTLMSWKKPTTGPFLRLPRPYPRKLYPEKLLNPVKADSRCVDECIRSLPKPRPGARILHILEVSSEFEGVGHVPAK
ncbi:unnamed protein product [Dibothriocephalus latus]|uniref:Uncharacterized protein n=1 Tax=Dibothriocephalus latus TaxID=60516 RepID=A0A3P7N954_DIBLA|nr:unnamed protein product [Dibothriocephalus latus]